MLEGRSSGSVGAFGCCCLVIWHFCVFGVLIVGTLSFPRLPFPHPCCFLPYFCAMDLKEKFVGTFMSPASDRHHLFTFSVFYTSYIFFSV